MLLSGVKPGHIPSEIRDTFETGCVPRGPSQDQVGISQAFAQISFINFQAFALISLLDCLFARVCL